MILDRLLEHLSTEGWKLGIEMLADHPLWLALLLTTLVVIACGWMIYMAVMKR